MRAQNYLKERLESLLSEMGLTYRQNISIEPPKESSFGDMATNAAMILAKQAKKPPREIAGNIAEGLKRDSSLVQSVEVAGPGFINVFFTKDFWRETASVIHEQHTSFGSSTIGRNKKVQVEFVSANPTGPLHIGHGRGAAVGDSLARILKFTGHDVTTEYYINDAGRQMWLLGLSIFTRYLQLQGRDIPFPEDCYKGDYIKDIAQELLDLHGTDLQDLKEEESIEICKKYGMERILKEIKEDLEKFRVRHDVWFSEKSLLDSGKVEEVFSGLKKNSLAYEEDGALWFKTTEFGDDKNRVLKKSDGLLTYFASDIAYHSAKYAMGYDLVVDIWGADHHGYIPRMKAAVQALGKEPEDLQIILVQLVNLLRGGEQVAMSTRAGEFETLQEVSKEVGVDAARFIFLSRKSDSHLDFDLELVKQQSMENPVYYVQYAHARICSVMRKAVEKGFSDFAFDKKALEALQTEEEFFLLKTLDQFPDIVAAAARTLSPHHISYYLQSLAGLLHKFYTTHSVLGAENAEIVKARILLLQGVAQVVRNGLELLGVQAPERM